MIQVPSMRPEPARDRWGRYLLPTREGEGRTAYTRATTLAHTLSDHYSINQWQRRKTAEGLALDAGLLDSVLKAADALAEAEAAGVWALAKERKAELNDLCEAAAKVAGAKQGSELGTALHSLTEWADAGRLREVLVPEELSDDLDAYLDGMAAAGIERPPEYIERIVVNFQVGTAGTFDRLVRVPGYDKLVIADLKTQKSVDFGFLEPAIQFAEYAYADRVVDVDTGELVEMPEVDREVGLLLHLPVGKARLTIYEVDLVEGWAAAVHAWEARAFRDRARSMARLWTPPALDPAWLLYMIGAAPDVDLLTRLWDSQRDVWADEHTAAAKARKEALLVSAALES